MALHYLTGVDERWQLLIDKVNRLIPEMNNIAGLEIRPLENGTNSYKMLLSDKIDPNKLSTFLLNTYNMIWMPRAMDGGGFNFTVNESLMTVTNDQILLAWKKGIEAASK